ncbi:unnamed protein product [Dibothriocephalus latus]|uniref:Uncharacterized protein n=1 Tax=Dibothriocephalus latus TaxID=60516 RepID=A0A3P7N3E5_DIBLA|nr:unnamed protein product [Dibothriocephalus latus]
MAAVVGLKMSACMLVLGVWGFIMLVLMGVFTRVNAVAFAEDIPINMTEWEALGFPSAYIDEKYAMVSTTCFIAAGLYVAVLIFGAVQLHMNTRFPYTAH